MKRELSLLFVFLLLTVCPLVASATNDEGFFKEYTDDELINLNIELQQEIVDRGLNRSATISSGYYLVGQDIPAGSYILSNFNVEKARVTLHAVDSEGKFLWRVDYSPDEDDEDYNPKIVLMDGDFITLQGGSCTMTIFTGVVFQ